MAKKQITSKIEQLDFTNSNEINVKRICEVIKISKEDAEELLEIKSINEHCDPPSTFSEMKESKKMAEWFWKKLDKFPLLYELGFSDCDVHDFTQD